MSFGNSWVLIVVYKILADAECLIQWRNAKLLGDDSSKYGLEREWIYWLSWIYMMKIYDAMELQGVFSWKKALHTRWKYRECILSASFLRLILKIYNHVVFKLLDDAYSVSNRFQTCLWTWTKNMQKFSENEMNRMTRISKDLQYKVQVQNTVQKNIGARNKLSVSIHLINVWLFFPIRIGTKHFHF